MRYKMNVRCEVGARDSPYLPTMHFSALIATAQRRE